MMDGIAPGPLLLDPLTAKIPGLPQDLVPQVLCSARHAYGVCRAWDQLLAALNGEDHYYFAVVRHLRVALATGDWSGYRRLLRLEPCRVFEVACGDLHHEVRAYCAHLGLGQWPPKEAMQDVTDAVLSRWRYDPGDVMCRAFGLAGVRWGARARPVHKANTDLCALHDALVLGALSELPRGAASQELVGEYTLDEDATGELRSAHGWAPARFAGAAGAPPEAAEVCAEWRTSTAADIPAPPATPEPHAEPHTPSDFGYPTEYYGVRPLQLESAHERAKSKARRQRRSRVETALEDLCDTLIDLRGRYSLAMAPLSRCGRWGAHALQKFITAAADEFERGFDAAVMAAQEAATAEEHARTAEQESSVGREDGAPRPIDDKPVRYSNLDGHYDSSSDTEWFAAADAAPDISETDTRELMKALMADGYFSGEGEEYLPGGDDDADEHLSGGSGSGSDTDEASWLSGRGGFAVTARA